MLLGGGSSCQQCGCAPGCPECLYSVECGCLDIDYDEITGSLTVDGTTLSFSGATKYVTPSADVTACFRCTAGSTPAVFFDFRRVVSTGPQIVNGCEGCFVRLSILFKVMDSCYSAPVQIGKSFDYLYKECSDEGGSTFVESEWQINESQGFSAECMSLLIDFAETFPITGSVFFEPCYAAP
jgi:hypothetical protein